MLLDTRNGEVPEDHGIKALPGVSRKTASVVLNTAFSWPAIAVDTHIYRLSKHTECNGVKRSTRC